MRSFDEARREILAGVVPTAGERVELARAAGRVLAEDLVAGVDLPGFDASAMDGYAVAVADLGTAFPVELPVVGESRAGGDVPARVEPGTTCRIFTGAPTPDRADAVVMQERVERTDNRARFAEPPRPGQNIRSRGEDLRRGTRALGAGTRLGPQHLALCAALGHGRVTVARRPVVTLLSTGDELREPGEPERPGSVVDACGPALAAMVRACGGDPRTLPFARDTHADTLAALRAALPSTDLLVTVGGVSVGDHDVVRAALEEAGIALDFWRVAIKPGKPLAVGHAGARRFLGLPGNPASALVTFALFGAPLVRALQGDAAPEALWLPVRLAAPHAHATGRTEFARARFVPRGGELAAELQANQASGAVTSLAWADGLVELPADVARFETGAALRAVRFCDV